MWETRNLVPADCELAGVYDEVLVVTAHPKFSRRAVWLNVACRHWERCTGFVKMKLWNRNPVLASASFDLPEGKSRTLRLRRTKRGLRTALRRGLGHTDTSVTARVYVHAYESARRSSARAERLEAMYGSGLEAADGIGPQHVESEQGAEVHPLRADSGRPQ